VNWTNNQRSIIVVCVTLIFVTAALYWPVRHFDFVQYDDDAYVFGNPDVMRGLTWDGVVWSLVDAHDANWHPVTWISHMLDCQLFGLNPGAPHVVNAVLHCVNSALLFLLVRAMTGTLWRSAFVAAVFAWHPLRVESVAWVSERKDVLSGFFFMLTLWVYILYAKRALASSVPVGQEPPSAQRPRFDRLSALCLYALRPAFPASLLYRFSLAFFVLGLLSKPMLVTVPFILLMIDYWPLGRFHRTAPSWESGVELIREKIPFFVASMAVGTIALCAQNAGGALVSLKSEGIATRMGHAVADYFGYLAKLFWPRELTVLYLRPEAVPVLTMVSGVIVLLAVTTIAAVNLRRRPYVAVGWAWFIVMLLPVCGLFQAGPQSIADRYTYLPAIGLALIVSWGVKELATAMLPRQAVGAVLMVAVCGLLLSCAALTRRQLAFWQNTETLMEHALKVDPNNYVAHQDLGVYYSKLGLREAARAHRQRVRELDPALRQHSSSVSTNSIPTSPNSGNRRNDE
jgi:tetratricopeptide (TPR) repeat protein